MCYRITCIAEWLVILDICLMSCSMCRWWRYRPWPYILFGGGMLGIHDWSEGEGVFKGHPDSLIKSIKNLYLGPELLDGASMSMGAPKSRFILFSLCYLMTPLHNVWLLRLNRMGGAAVLELWLYLSLAWLWRLLAIDYLNFVKSKKRN